MYNEARITRHSTGFLFVKQEPIMKVYNTRKKGKYKNCITCGISFYVKRHLLEEKKFCSMNCYNLDKKGRPIWNKGKPWSAEAKKKMSEAKKRSGHSGVKNLIPRYGADNPAWKGGVTKESRAERAKFRKVLQAKVLKRDNYTCQVCDQYSGYLQVDHIKPWADYPDLRFELSNCRTLCMACHYYITFKRTIPKGIIWGHNMKHRIEQ